MKYKWTDSMKTYEHMHICLDVLKKIAEYAEYNPYPGGKSANKENASPG